MEFLNLIKNEFILDIKKLKDSKISFLTDITIFTTVLFVTLVTGLDSSFSNFYGIDIKQGKMLVIIGFIFWQISTTALGWSSQNIRRQSLSGTLELKLQSKFSLELLTFIEMSTYLFISFLSFFIIFIVFIIAIGGSFSDILYVLLSYIISIPALFGMYGIGLLLGGISLKEKLIGNFVYIIQTALAFISDLSGEKSRIFNIIPFNAGIKIMRGIYLGENIPLNLVFDYFIVNIIWLTIGIIIFRKLLKQVRRNGSFSNY